MTILSKIPNIQPSESTRAVADLLYMTPAVRKLQADLLRTEETKNFFTLLAERNKSARLVSDQGEYCQQLIIGNVDPGMIIQQMQILVLKLLELLVLHVGCVGQLPELEQNGAPQYVGR